MNEIYIYIYIWCVYIYIYIADEKCMKMYTVSLGVMLRNRKISWPRRHLLSLSSQSTIFQLGDQYDDNLMPVSAWSAPLYRDNG